MKNQNILKWIIKNSKGEIPKIFILSISNILLALVATVLALVSKLAIDSAQRAATASSNAEFLHYRNLIIFNCILILVVITSRLLLRVFTQSLTIRVQAKMEMKMRGRLFYSIMMKDYGKINKYHSGELMNRITSDVKIVTEGIISIVPDALYFLTQFVGAFVVLIIFDWKFTMLFIAAGIVMSIIAVFFRGKLKNISKQVQETDGKVRSFFQEAIESMLVVKTFGLEKQFDKKGNILQRTNYEVKMKRRKITIFANAGFSFIFNAGYLFALGWCAIKVSMKAMTYGTLTAVLQLISQIQTPFVSITKMFPQYYAVLASAERIMEIENITNEESTYEKIDVKQTYDKPVCQFSIIGKDKKSFRILIKPPHRKQIFCQKRHFPFPRKTTAAHGIQNRLFSRILCGRHDSGRLMKKKILVLLPTDSLSFHLNDILCGHLISSIFDHSILNFYQSGCHLLFNLTSRPFGMIG